MTRVGNATTVPAARRSAIGPERRPRPAGGAGSAPGEPCHGRARGRALNFGTLALAALCAALQIGCALEPGGTGLPDEGGRAGDLLLPSLGGPVLPVQAFRRADFRGEPHSGDARDIADWVVDSADHGARAFAVVDKQQAQIFVFDAHGRLLGAAPVLLGLAPGDDTVPGIGGRALTDIRPEERTTPAGRFVAEPGRNLDGEDIVWVDYDTGVSMHRVRATKPAERRLQRLASATPADNRISYGCINLPADFYDEVLSPAFAEAKGIVYVLPETRPTLAEFGAYDSRTRATRYAAGERQEAAGGPGAQ